MSVSAIEVPTIANSYPDRRFLRPQLAADNRSQTDCATLSRYDYNLFLYRRHRSGFDPL